MQSLPSTAREPLSQTTRIIIVVTMLVLAAIAVYVFRNVFTPLVIGAVIAYVLHPVAKWVSKLTRLPHGWATGLIYLVLLAIIIPVGIALVPVAIDQLLGITAEVASSVTELQNLSPTSTIMIGSLELDAQLLVEQVTVAITDLLGTVASESIAIVFDAAEILLLLVFTVIIAFYLTRDGEKFIAWIVDLIPAHTRSDADRLLGEISDIWSAFFRGQVILVFIVGVLITGIGYLIGLPRPVLMGSIAGLLEFLPTIGHTIWLFSALTIALIEGSTWLPIPAWVFAILVVVVQVLYTQFDLNYLIPRIIGERVHLHPMVVILGIIVGAQVGGVLGVVLAAPTIASLRIIGRYVYARLFDIEPFTTLHEGEANSEA